MRRLLTTKEVANYLRLRKETVLRKAEKGAIPAIKVDGRWRFPQEQLEEWLREKEQTTAVKPTVKVKRPIKLKAYPLGIIGGLSRREIYEGGRSLPTEQGQPTVGER